MLCIQLTWILGKQRPRQGSGTRKSTEEDLKMVSFPSLVYEDVSFSARRGSNSATARATGKDERCC